MREPFTGATLAHYDWLNSIGDPGREATNRATIEAIQAEAVKPWRKAFSRVTIGHSLTPRCRELMPTDGRCSCGYDEARALLKASKSTPDKSTD